MKYFVCNLFLSIFFFSGFAQELLKPLPAAKFITRFSFKQYSGGVMVVKAQFGNIADSLNFILDTGSGGISLDSATCTDLKIPITPTDTVITGMGDSHKVSFIFNQTLNFKGLTVNNLNFHVNNYEVLTSVFEE